jgi:VWFA-related protein
MFGTCFSKSANIKQHLRLLLLALLFLTVAYPDNSAFAQKQKPSSSQLERKLDETSQEPDDVVRIRTDLVQTSVAVFDKRGKFIDNLRPEDFELRIDGKPYPILFFDRVINGIGAESPKANAPRNGAVASRPAGPDATRAVLFFVDDLHLAADSVTRTRNMLSNYIEREMGVNDEAVIASASGQIGFLQQLTRERDVLRGAVDRLKYRPLNLMDNDRPRMSAYQALSIERGDSDVLEYFIQALLNDELAFLAAKQPQLARDIAERRTHSRATRIVRQVGLVATQTLAALNTAVRSSAQIPGRKLFVFISDGFFINNPSSNITDRLQHIADAAVHSGAVLYTIQASGLNTTFPDAGSDAVLTGVGTGRVLGEDIAVQDPLTQLASDTGGHALLNANDLNRSVKRALQESNDYYLLSWRPDTENINPSEFHRLEVSVKGRSDLSVLMQRGFFNDAKTAAAPVSAVKPKAAEGFPIKELAAIIKGQSNGGELIIYLTANYLDVPNHGARLSILMRAENRKADSPPGPVEVDVAGVVYNDSGKLTTTFVDTLKPETNALETQYTTYLNQVDIKPGLYQVRVAARDSHGLIGVASQWVKIPDLASHRLSLSSLLIGGRDITGTGKPTDALQFQKAQVKIDKRFVQGSRLRFLTFIYNARETFDHSEQLDVHVELFHNNMALVSTPDFAIETRDVSDPARVPYAGEFNLASLPKGHYLLRVTVTDRSAKTNASQEAAFEIE